MTSFEHRLGERAMAARPRREYLAESQAGALTPQELDERRRIEIEHPPVDRQDPPARSVE
jgi:hypothetical protein